MFEATGDGAQPSTNNDMLITFQMNLMLPLKRNNYLIFGS